MRQINVTGIKTRGSLPRMCKLSARYSATTCRRMARRPLIGIAQRRDVAGRPAWRTT